MMRKHCASRRGSGSRRTQYREGRSSTASLSVANTQIGSYECLLAVNAKAEPEWPAESFEDLLKIAFRDRFIQSLDHEVLRKLRGEE